MPSDPLFELVAKLDQLHLEATPGPWGIASGNFITADWRDNPNNGSIVAEVPCQGANDADLAFIAELRNAWPTIRANLGWNYLPPIPRAKP
jgi:hypothetical protein